jgi:hypothetical protein
VISIIFVFFLIFSFFKIINPINCYDWAKGLNNTYIENDINKNGCKINFPTECPYKIGKYFQDLTRIKNIKCTERKLKEREILLRESKSPFINQKTKKFGFPYTNKNENLLLDSKDDILIENFFLKNLIDMDKMTNFNNGGIMPEILLDFSKSKLGQMNIDIKFNESLSKERKKIENNISPYSNNIMIIYFDSVSRAYSMRQLKKTLHFFENFIPYQGGFNKKFQNEKFHSFQFFKYHSFRIHTTGNYPRLFYGKKRESKKLVKISYYAKQCGYITNFCIDVCQRDNIRTLHNLTINEVEDHQFLICDPNRESFNQNFIKCLYGKQTIEYLIEYSNQFWRKYKNNRKFSLIISNDAHEGTIEILKYMDNIIYNFLNNLFNDNLLKDSTIFLLSDHGVGMPSVYYFYKFYKYEEHLPMLYILMNDRKNISYNEQYYNINENQQTFITAYDIYNTICHLMYGNEYQYILNKTSKNDTPKSPLGKSLLTKINKKERSPKKYEDMEVFVCE